MAYSSAYFTHEGQPLADAQRAKLDLICRKLDLRPGYAAAGRRLRMGLADPARCRALRRARHRHHAVGAAARLRVEAGRRSWTGGPGRGAAAGLPRARRNRRAVRRRQLRSRWASTSARSNTPPTPRSCIDRCSPGGRLCCSRCRATRTPHPAAGRSSSPTSRRTCTCGRCRRRSRTSRRPASRSATSRRCASTTSRTVAHWLDTFESHWDDVRRPAWARRSPGCGGCTSSAAR